MAVFQYIAKDSGGGEFSGVYTDIDTISSLREELGKLGYTLVKAKKEKGDSGQSHKKIKSAEIVTFAYEFSGMYTAGLSITRCIETLEKQTSNESLKKILTDIRQKIETGSTLHEAFLNYKSVFSDFFVGMIEAGEMGGKLGDTLAMSAEYLEKQADVKRKVRSAFAYPIIVTVMCLLIVSALVIFVIPVFQKLYSQLKVQLPAPTMMLIFLSTVVREYIWYIVPGVVGGVFLLKHLFKNPAVKAKWDAFKLSMPVFGNLNRMVTVGKFTRTFSMMASAGVSIVDSFDLAISVADNSIMKKVGKDVQEQVMVGSSLEASMSKFDIFPPMIIQMAASGEEAGVLPEMLGKGTDFLDIQIERTVNSLLIKIEPILSLVMGTVVGGILLGVYLPMFDYMGHVK